MNTADLIAQIGQKRPEIEAWFELQWALTPPNFYTSVDIRHAEHKLAPVDTNLFPAGFNNIDSQDMSTLGSIAKQTLNAMCPEIKRLLLLSESHTRNIPYFASLSVIKAVLEAAGITVRVGSLSDGVPDDGLHVDLAEGGTLHVEKINRQDNRIGVGDFFPHCILSNHDFSGEVPDILLNIEQTIFPSLDLGWNNRLKSAHFYEYEQVALQLAQVIDCDPWMIYPYYDNCENVDFMQSTGENCLARRAEKLFFRIQEKYTAHGIKDKPFVVVKADAGTYGMGVMMVDKAEELLNLNRKQRKKMAATKGSTHVTKAMLQEGVQTTVQVDGETAEPVIYMLGKTVAGGFYRMHGDKSSTDNLNAPGAHFQAFHPTQTHTSEPATDILGAALSASVNDTQYAYTVIARLASLATAKEKANLKTD